MIVLDTSVISEPMRASPEINVVDWLNTQSPAGLFTTSVSILELRLGVARLPEGKRKAGLWEVLDFTLSRLVGARVLPFDESAAIEAAGIAADAERKGRPIGQADCQIAAIVRSCGFAIASRDVDPFEQAEVAVINPWEIQ